MTFKSYKYRSQLLKSPVTWFNWLTNVEPNNYNGDEHYMINYVNRNNWQWGDHGGQTTADVLCQYEPGKLDDNIMRCDGCLETNYKTNTGVYIWSITVGRKKCFMRMIDEQLIVEN